MCKCSVHSDELSKYTPAMWNAFAVNVARRLAITVYCGIFHTKQKKQSKEESPPEFMKIHRNYEKNVKKTEIYEKKNKIYEKIGKTGMSEKHRIDMNRNMNRNMNCGSYCGSYCGS